ncbi:MAG: STAS domain-containing protein [Marmoricola sp.]
MLAFTAIVEIDETEQAAVVVEGELSEATALLLVGAVSAALHHAAATTFILDLRGVDTIGAPGLDAILDIRRAVVAGGRRLEVLGASSTIERALSPQEAA